MMFTTELIIFFLSLSTPSLLLLTLSFLFSNVPQQTSTTTMKQPLVLSVALATFATAAPTIQKSETGHGKPTLRDKETTVLTVLDLEVETNFAHIVGGTGHSEWNHI